MRLGISLPYARPGGNHLSIEEVGRRARQIEEAGFDGIWFGESIGRGDSARPDILIWLTIAAQATKTIELGTAILQVPMRPPVELAQRLMTMHALTGGRFSAGLGAGSTKIDFDAVGVDYDTRFKALAEGLPTIRRLCRGEQVGAAILHPWPDTAGGPPILIGSWESGIWVKRAAQEYDGWMGSGRTTLSQLRDGINRYRDAGGKRAMVVTIETNLHAPSKKLGADEHFNLTCGPEEASERLQRLAELGYDDACLVQFNHTEATLPLEDLHAIRALLPKA